MTYKATVTPTGLLLRGPDAGVSNRVLRKYADKSEYFLRVFFADEDGLSVLHDPRASQERIYARFRELLIGGIAIAGRQYTYVAPWCIKCVDCRRHNFRCRTTCTNTSSTKLADFLVPHLDFLASLTRLYTLILHGSWHLSPTMGSSSNPSTSLRI
jgi:hypothetical protein